MTIPKLHVPHIRFNKTALLLIGAGLVFLLIFAYGAVRQVQASHVKAEQQDAAKATADKVEAAHLAQVKQLEASLTAASAAKAASCGQLKTLSANKAVSRYVTVPAVCNVQ